MSSIRTPSDLNRPVKERLQELVDLHGCPLEEMFMIAKDIEEDKSARLQALKELANYIYPKRKAIELSGPDGEPIGGKIDTSKLTDKELDTLLKLTAKAASE